MVNELSNITSSSLRFMGFTKIFNSNINVNDVSSRLRSIVKTVSHTIHVRGAESWLFVVTVFASGGLGIVNNTVRLTDGEEDVPLD
jgi:hypothetical protein